MGATGGKPAKPQEDRPLRLPKGHPAWPSMPRGESPYQHQAVALKPLQNLRPNAIWGGVKLCFGTQIRKDLGFFALERALTGVWGGNSLAVNSSDRSHCWLKNFIGNIF